MICGSVNRFLGSCCREEASKIMRFISTCNMRPSGTSVASWLLHLRMHPFEDSWSITPFINGRTSACIACVTIMDGSDRSWGECGCNRTYGNDFVRFEAFTRTSGMAVDSKGVPICKIKSGWRLSATIGHFNKCSANSTTAELLNRKFAFCTPAKIGKPIAFAKSDIASSIILWSLFPSTDKRMLPTTIIPRLDSAIRFATSCTASGDPNLIDRAYDFDQTSPIDDQRSKPGTSVNRTPLNLVKELILESPRIGPASGARFSRNWILIWTGPRSSLARCMAWQASESAIDTGISSLGGKISRNQRMYESENVFTWSIAWFAPMARLSYGRSAVKTNKGNPSIPASIMAGYRLATAVPLDVRTAHRLPVPRTNPTARKPAARSSWTLMAWTTPTLERTALAIAATNGVDRDPGQT